MDAVSEREATMPTTATAVPPGWADPPESEDDDVALALGPTCEACGVLLPSGRRWLCPDCEALA